MHSTFKKIKNGEKYGMIRLDIVNTHRYLHLKNKIAIQSPQVLDSHVPSNVNKVLTITKKS